MPPFFGAHALSSASAIELDLGGNAEVPYPIQDKVVIAVASSALFDLSASHAIFLRDPEEYRRYQREHQDDVLKPGVAFPFIRRLLSFNGKDATEQPVEVILLSRNDSDTGLRVMKSIKAHGLDITRAAFLRGEPPWPYAPAFNACLFLSANESDVREAVLAGIPAGVVLASTFEDDVTDNELRVAFDFDGIIIDDEAEIVYQTTKSLEAFHQAETDNALKVHNPGLLKDLLVKIARLQDSEMAKQAKDRNYKPRIKTAIITARNAPSHERMINTLRTWGIQVDQTFFLGGIEKKRVLEVFKPHIFFDDQRVHLDPASGVVPCVHVPIDTSHRVASVARDTSAPPPP